MRLQCIVRAAHSAFFASSPERPHRALFRNMVRVALVLTGKIGQSFGADRPAGTSSARTDGPFNVSVHCWRRAALQAARSQSVTLFVHSWDVGWRRQITSAFRPKAATFEKQIHFQPPDTDASSYVTDAPERDEAWWRRRGGPVCRDFLRQVSMWYSRARAMELVASHERESGWAFDLVHLARLDACPEPCIARRINYSSVSPRPGHLAFGAASPEEATAQPFMLHWLQIGTGTSGFVVPQVSDRHVFGPARELLELSDAMWRGFWNATRALGACSAHAVLAAQALRLYGRARLDPSPIMNATTTDSLKVCDEPRLVSSPRRCLERYCRP